MSFTESTPPDITEALPARLSGRAGSSAFSASDFTADIAIGGLPFRLCISDERLSTRQTAPFRKEQSDTSKEAGEQSLDGYWLRSQTSFHKGAGVAFYEPGAEVDTSNRFATSVGVDVWTPGDASLLKKCNQIVSGAGTYGVATAIVAGADSIVTTDGSTVTLIGSAGTTVSTTTLATTSAATTPAVSGKYAYVGHNVGIDKVDLAAATATRIWTQAAAESPKVYFVKGRLIATRGQRVYQLAGTGALDAGTGLAIFEHPSADWVWTGVTETPGAILVSGYSAGYGGIYRFALEPDTSGTLPKLGQPSQVADFPPGEEVHSVRVYLGQYIAIGTSRGVRVGFVEATGEMQYGPLIIRTALPVRSLAARDAFIYAAVENAIDGKSGVARISLEEEVSPLRYPWAFDAQALTTGTVGSIAFLGASDRIAVSMPVQGVWLQSATEYVAEGYIDTGAVRYGTVEPKLFRFARVRAKIPGGAVVLSTIASNGNVNAAYTFGSDATADQDIILGNPVGTQEYISLRFTLRSNVAVTPVLEAWGLKSVPAPSRQRLITYPLLCFDREKDRYGVDTGYEGFAFARVEAMDGLENGGGVVLVQDFRTGESFSAQVEGTTFLNSTPPDRESSGFGGVLTVLVRKL